MAGGAEHRGPGLVDVPPHTAGDRQLWERYVARGDRDAFAALVARHGPLVLGVCRRVLRHAQDAEDAFQATFLILARKARSVKRPELLGPWLYGVAYRTALKARTRAVRRREGPVTDAPAPEPREPVEPDVREALDAELGRLPEKYRAPLVLCYLEGKSTEDAARALGCPKGTVLSRLARGRDRLRRRLVRRGLALTGVALAALLSGRPASAAEVPASLIQATVRAATGVGGAASVPAGSLASAVLRDAGRRAALRWAVYGITAAAVVAAGAFAYRTLAGRGPAGDTERLQGGWKVVAVRASGTDLAPANFPFDRLVFRGETVTLEKAGTGRTVPFRLDPAARPKAIDVVFGMDGATDVRAGIYALNGYNLRLCLPDANNVNRPTEFASPPDTPLLLLTCRRERY